MPSLPPHAGPWLALCLALGPLGCGKLRLVEETRTVSPVEVLDARRILVATMHTRIYERENFFTPADLHRNDFRFFLIATDSPGVIRPLGTRTSGWRQCTPNAAGTAVILDYRTVFDLERDALHVLPSTAGLLKADFRAERPWDYLYLAWGPGAGEYIVKASDWDGEASVVSFYLLSEKDRKFRFLGSDTGSPPLVGVVAQGGSLWAAFRVDSSTLAHRPLEADTGGHLIRLPSKMTEYSRIHYERRWNGLWLVYDCWNCDRHGARILRVEGPAESSDWERYDSLPGADTVLNRNWVGVSDDRKRLEVWPRGKEGDSLVYDFSDYLR